MMQQLYAAATTAISPLLPLWLHYRVTQGKEDSSRFGERFGKTSVARPVGKLLWCHAASVGETASVLLLLETILAAHPALTVLLTTGTLTSAEMVKKRDLKNIIHQFVPFDVPHIVRRFLNHWRPDAVLWVESELWPVMLHALQRRAIPAVFLNARMSETSQRNWLKQPQWIKSLLRSFALTLSQTEKDVAMFKQLGAENCRYVGNLKHATDPLPVVEAGLQHIKKQIENRPCWLMANTHTGEEAYALTVHEGLKKEFPGLLTVIVPRHPDRGDAIAAMLARHSVAIARRTHNDSITPETDIYLADTLGELGLFYRLAPIVCLGGSFGGVGGHNPIEAAWLNCAILCGPDMRNCIEVAEQMKTQQALWQLRDPVELIEAVRALLQNPSRGQAMATAAYQLASTNRSVLNRVMAELTPVLGEALQS